MREDGADLAQHRNTLAPSRASQQAISIAALHSRIPCPDPQPTRKGRSFACFWRAVAQRPALVRLPARFLETGTDGRFVLDYSPDSN
jgi:hypothetical protein